MHYQTVIIDDDRVICMLINKILDKTRLSKAKVFNKAVDALQSIIENDSELQNYLIFLDINMPEMNGWEFLDAMKEQQLKSKIHVSIITSSINKSDKEKAEDYGYIFNYIIKPIKLENIKALEKYDFLVPFHRND